MTTAAQVSVRSTLIAAIPDVLLSWLWAENQTNGGLSDFLAAMAAIQAFHLVLWIKRQIGATLAFRLYGRDAAAQLMAEGLLRNAMPEPLPGEDAEDYFTRVMDDDNQPPIKRMAACVAWARSQDMELIGFLASRRVNAMQNAAVSIYRDTMFRR